MHTNTLHADEVRARERRQTIWTILWWLPSIILHLLFISAVGYYGWQEFVEKPDPEKAAKPPAELDAETYEQLAETIESVRLNEILKQLDELQIILHNMDVLKNEIAKTYDEFAEAEAEQAKEEDLVDKLFERTLALQDTTAEKLEKAADASKRLSEAAQKYESDPNSLEEVRKIANNEIAPAYDNITTAQSDAHNTLDRIANEAKLIGLPETARLTEEVRDIQLQANQKQSETSGNLEGAIANQSRFQDTANNIKKRDEQIRSIAEERAKAEESLAKHEAEAKRLREEEKAAREELTQADKTINEAREALNKAKREREETRRASEEAVKTAQRHIDESIRQRNDADRKMKDLHQKAERTKNEDEAKRFREEETVAREERDKKEQAIAEAKEEKAKAETERNEKGRAMETAERDASRHVDETVRERKNVEGKVNDRRQNAERNERDANNDRRVIADRTSKIERLEGQNAEDNKQLAEIREKLNVSNQRLPAAHAENVTAQEAIRKKVAEIREFAKTEAQKREQMFQQDFHPQVATYEDLSRLDLVDAYQKAVKLEELITESYKDVKSFELAMQAKTDFKTAEALTDVAKSVRREPDAAVLREAPQTQAQFDRQKQEQVDTIHEAERMVDSTLAMMEAAVEIVRSGKEGAFADRGSVHVLQKFAVDFEAAAQEMPEAAMAGEGQAASDAADAASPPAASEQAQAMADKAYVNEQLRAAAAETSEKAKDLSELMKAVDEAMGTEGTGSGGARQKIEQILAKNKGRAIQEGSVPMLRDIDTGLVPGNIVSLSGESGVPARWMYISSWYIIGPFDNPNRVNLTRKFAPESTIDLNASYVGRNGERVRWQFMQTSNNPTTRDWTGARGRYQSMLQPPGDPPYTIWYGYTEVFFDRECDLWIATGSDDREDIWINDMHVWNSSNALKCWTINEGYRKVHFRKGRNRILVRLENGHYTMGYSVTICLNEGEKPAL